jgi:hypothetical protein
MQSLRLFDAVAVIVPCAQMPRVETTSFVGMFAAAAGRFVMKDVIFMLAIVIFFGVSILYVYGCERLK